MSKTCIENVPRALGELLSAGSEVLVAVFERNSRKVM